MSEETRENTNSEQTHHHHHHHHHHHEHESSSVTKAVKKPARSRKPVKKELFVLGGILLLLALGLFLVWRFDARGTDPAILESMSAAVRESVSDDELYKKWSDGGESGKGTVVAYKGRQYRQREDLTTILLMGLDVYGLNERIDRMTNRQQADFLLLIGIDEANKKGVALHINRDTMTDVMTKDLEGNNAGTVYQQICLSHNYGKDETAACENTVDAAVNLLYGTKIDHYLCTTMDAVEYLNDAVGGVTVTCLDDFPENGELKAGKEVTLKGQQALTYVRARMNMPDDTNLRRMERQQQYLAELRKKCVEKCAQDPGFLLQSLLAIAEKLVSDCRINELSDIANAAVSYDFGNILTIKGDNVQGQNFMEYYPDEDVLQKQVIDLFYEEVR